MKKIVPVSMLVLFLAGCAAPVKQAPQLERSSPVAATVSADGAAVTARVQAELIAARPESALIQSLVRDKRYDAAREEAEKLVAKYPDNSVLIYLLAQTAMFQDRRAEGEALFERVYRLALQDPSAKPGDLLLILAGLARERHDLAASRAWLDKVDPAEKPQFFLAQIERANLLSMAGDQASALALIASLEPTTPEQDREILYAKGNFLHEAGRIDEAFAVLAEGTPRVPPQAELFNLFSIAAKASGRHEEAESAARSAIRIAPDKPIAYNNLAFWLADRNVRVDEALTLITKALELAPDSSFSLGTMGWVQYRLGNLNKAETFLLRSYTLEPNDEIAVELGEVLWHKGDKAGARKWLRDVQRKAPSNATLRATLERLKLTL